MQKGIALVAILALLLTGCTGRKAETAPEPEAASPATTPVAIAVGSSEGDDTLALAAPTAPGTPIPVGKVEYHAEEGAHYKILPDKTVSVTGGCVEITVNGMAFSSAVQTSDGGSVRLCLTNGASLTGVLTGESMLDVSVSLDETSVWSLAGDTRVDALVNADTSFANVSSNGCTLSYNCENAENAYLARATLPLNGGGQLQPLI